MPLLISLEGPGTLAQRVYAGLRRAILGGTLPPGRRLPSSRGLARELGVARTTVVAAFEQLAAEGYVAGRRGAGTFVARELPEAAMRARAQEPGLIREGRPPRLSTFGRRLERLDPIGPRSLPGLRFDFSYGAPPLESRSHESWLRLSNRIQREAPHEAFLYGQPEGDERLRVAIAAHLEHSRALRCRPEEVLIVNGTQQALDLAARVLLDPGDPVLLEEPHYLGARQVFAAGGARLSTQLVDEAGLDPARLPTSGETPRLVHVTPSHQFPTGGTMSVARRLALLEWAERHDALVFEDDYDSEYRFEGRPLESLQGLDRAGRVLYAGTFSKVLFPGLRCGYLVLPPALVEPFRKAKALSDRHTPTLVQRTLATFLEEGHFERRLRRERARFALRRTALLAALEAELGERVAVQGEKAGIHLVAWLRESPTGGLAAALDRAARAGIGLQSVDHCYLGEPPGEGLLLGFVAMDEERLAAGVAALRRALWPGQPSR